MTTTKRILVVDDDPDLLFLAAHGLKSGNLPYEVSTAANAVTALAMVKAQPFAVIVTDYMMPDMTGLELIASVREIAPETIFIMMTAHHDTGGVRRTAMSMGVSGFVSKPFVLADLLNAINQAAAPADPMPGQADLEGFLNQAIIDRLAEFQRQTSAWCVMLIDAKGVPLHVVGRPKPDRVARLTAFIAGTFSVLNEVAGLFDDQEPHFRSSYYEGDQYNIYAHETSGNFFLVVIIGAEVKPGSIWFYTKQTVNFIGKLLPSARYLAKDEAKGNVARDFEQLLGEFTPN